MSERSEWANKLKKNFGVAYIHHYYTTCPPTSISVEQGFSMLSKLLTKDRNFDKNNIFDYIFCYFNTKVILNEIQEESINYDDD